MGRIKLHKELINVRVEPFTRDWFAKQAEENGFTFKRRGENGEPHGQTGAFLDAIAFGKFKIVKNDEVKEDE